jgi:hypothetical protein
MSTKNNKRVYSKPVVQKPKKEKIEEQLKVTVDPEVTESHPIDPEVFETKLFVEEEPEEIKIEPHVEGEKLAEVLEKYHNIDAQAEIETLLEEELEKQTELVKDDELKEKLEEIKTNIEEFQTIQVIPVSPELEPEPIYTLTPEQEEEGAKVIAEMVNNSILEDLKALASEPPKERTLASLSNNELRYFHRTGQMPK